MYTIKLKRGGAETAVVVRWLEVKISNSRFTATFYRYGPQEIHVKPVRLREAKLYCGQHPGECQLGAKRKGRWLEWADWVEFHGLVNDVLDKLKVDADVWANPPERMDVGRKMWIRRGLRRRIHYGWEYGPANTRIWNHGTEDQFSE